MKINNILLFGFAIAILVFITTWNCSKVKTPNAFATYEGMDHDENDEGFEEGEPEEGFSDYIFSDTPISMSCSNGLCPLNNPQMMLQARGGNSSTGEAQIGN